MYQQRDHSIHRKKCFILFIKKKKGYRQGGQMENSKIRIFFKKIRKRSEIFLGKSEVYQKDHFFCEIAPSVLR